MTTHDPRKEPNA
jgi:hypothetical protein